MFVFILRIFIDLVIILSVLTINRYPGRSNEKKEKIDHISSYIILFSLVNNMKQNSSDTSKNTQPISKNDCQLIYQTLLNCLNNNQISSTTYIRELHETSNCDQFSDFKRLRQSLVNKINCNDTNKYERVLNFNETKIDQKVCDRVYLHYNNYHKSKLIKSLSYPNWLYYHTIERVERTLERAFHS